MRRRRRTMLTLLAAAAFATLIWRELPAASRYLKMERM